MACLPPSSLLSTSAFQRLTARRLLQEGQARPPPRPRAEKPAAPRPARSRLPARLAVPALSRDERARRAGAGLPEVGWTRYARPPGADPRPAGRRVAGPPGARWRRCAQQRPGLGSVPRPRPLPFTAPGPLSLRLSPAPASPVCFPSRCPLPGS